MIVIHFDEMQVNQDKGDYIPSDEELAELYDEYEHLTPCDNCEVKKWYARVVDYHIFGEEDCPYVCDEKGGRE